MTQWVVIRDINNCIVAAMNCDSYKAAETFRDSLYLGFACTAEITDKAPFFVERFNRENPESD